MPARTVVSVWRKLSSMSTPKRTERARARARDAWPTGWIHGRVMSGFAGDFATLRAWWQAGIAFNLHRMPPQDSSHGRAEHGPAKPARTRGVLRHSNARG